MKRPAGRVVDLDKRNQNIMDERLHRREHQLPSLKPSEEHDYFTGKTDTLPHKRKVEMEGKPRIHKGIAYYPSFQAARDERDRQIAAGHKNARVVGYQLGHAVQLEKSGDYVGPSAGTVSAHVGRKNAPTSKYKGYTIEPVEATSGASLRTRAACSRLPQTVRRYIDGPTARSYQPGGEAAARGTRGQGVKRPAGLGRSRSRRRSPSERRSSRARCGPTTARTRA